MIKYPVSVYKKFTFNRYATNRKNELEPTATKFVRMYTSFHSFLSICGSNGALSTGADRSFWLFSDGIDCSKDEAALAADGRDEELVVVVAVVILNCGIPDYIESKPRGGALRDDDDDDWATIGTASLPVELIDVSTSSTTDTITGPCCSFTNILWDMYHLDDANSAVP